MDTFTPIDEGRIAAVGEHVESSVTDPEPCVEVDGVGRCAFDELLVLVRALFKVLDDGDRGDEARDGDGDESLERRLDERLIERCSKYVRGFCARELKGSLQVV